MFSSSRLEELFHAAADLPDAEKADFLRSVCSSDPEMLPVLDSLLAADCDPASLQSPLLIGADSAFPPGTEVGSYRLVRELGRGGMGTVYLAERADGEFNQQAAVKVISAGLPDNRLARRFRRERQILARLDYPAIARLLDGGVTVGNRPYFVLEYVDGVRIDRYCKERRLSVRERLVLFLQVCGAVQYAHQNLIVHRDIKPANILVTSTRGEDSHQVKLLDFGIAKILADHEELDADQHTRTGLLLTLDYASPEQARGDPVGTRTDIYSLGTLLYELLAGQHPLGTSKSSLIETARRLQETEPERPSETAVHLPDRQILKGDLDRIVSVAMQKDPARRYPSVEAFAADIQRYLDGYPVLARGDSYRYRAGKFIRRHRTFVAAAALLILIVAGGIAALLHSAAATERQRVRAERRFGEIREVARALIFDIDPVLEGIPGTTSVRKLINDRALTYLDRLSADAAGDAALERELANGYVRLGTVQGTSSLANLGDEAGARSSFNKSLQLLQLAIAADPGNSDGIVQRVRTLDALGQMELMSGDPAAALAPHQQALNEIDALLSRTSHPSAKMLTGAAIASLDLAEVYAGNMNYANLGDPADAIPLMIRARELFEKVSIVVESDPNTSGRTYRFLNQAVAELELSGVDLLQLDRPDEAKVHVQLALNLLHSPGNDLTNSEIKRLLETVEAFRTRILLEQGDVASALELSASVLKMSDALVRADPVNQEVSGDHIIAEIQAGQAQTAAGQTMAGFALIDQALQENERMASGPAPDYLRSLLVTNCLIAGGAEFGAGRFRLAAHRFSRAAELARASVERHPSDVKAKFDLLSAEMGLARCFAHDGNTVGSAEHRSLAIAAAQKVFDLQAANPMARKLSDAARRLTK